MGKNKIDFRNKKNHRCALLFFLKMVDIFDHFKIQYFLEGGTLLGIVRDKNLFPWDHDIDFSINSYELEKFLKLRWYFFFKGYKFSIRRYNKNSGPYKKGDIYLIKLKPLFAFLAKELNFFKKTNIIVCDVFVKYSDGKYTYWKAKDKIMRVSSKYYAQNQTIKFLGRDVKVPAYYQDYLTEKYGNWVVPVKEWDCGKDEKTIFEEA